MRGCGNLKLTRLANRYLCDFGEKPTQQLTRKMNSNSTETATILINDFGLKGKTFPVFKVDERNVWLLIPHEVASTLIIEASSYILAGKGVAVRFPNWGIDTGDKKTTYPNPPTVGAFQVGDRVRYIGDIVKHKNKEGTIVGVRSHRYRCYWDEEKTVTEYLSRKEITK
jgi:hypothetical protein